MQKEDIMIELLQEISGRVSNNQLDMRADMRCEKQRID